MIKTIVIEPVRAFNDMDVLVARAEGLFEAEGLDVQFATPQPGELRSAAAGALAQPVTNQGRIQVKAPEPIQEAEAQLEWEWMASWGLLHGEFNADTQINAAVQQVAHAGR